MSADLDSSQSLSPFVPDLPLSKIPPDPSLMFSTDPLLYRRIFVNRSLHMDQVDAIGFDMDYTLAVYHQPQMEALTLRCVLKKLVENRGYLSEIFGLSYNPHFPIRGLVVDRTRGNLLKVDRYGYVNHGFHGSKLLSLEERESLYHKQRITFTYPHYAWIDTLYSLPEATLFTTLVDFIDRIQTQGSFPKEELHDRYARLWQDIRECTDEAHLDGTLNSEICANLTIYIEADPGLPATLHRFRSAGKKLFLLTNSRYPYAQCVMSYLLDGKHGHYPLWQHYFDFIVVDAKKPTFFTEANACTKIKVPLLTTDGPNKNSGQKMIQIHHGGNAHDLQEELGIPGNRILYIGDHIYGDMLRLKKAVTWRTALVIQELEQELTLQAELRTHLQRLEKLERRRIRIDGELAYQHALQHQLAIPPKTQPHSALTSVSSQKNRNRLDRLAMIHHAINQELSELEEKIYQQFHPHWGPLFKTRAENSLFGEQVKSYACVYTSRVTNFLAYSPFQSFRPPREHLPHERVY